MGAVSWKLRDLHGRLEKVENPSAFSTSVENLVQNSLENLERKMAVHCAEKHKEFFDTANISFLQMKQEIAQQFSAEDKKKTGKFSGHGRKYGQRI